MTGSTSVSEVTAIVAGSTVLVLATLLPLMRWARADHLTPRWIRCALRSTAVFLLILTATNGATR
jgi:hypothetical protein